jgi:hypothetical protein
MGVFKIESCKLFAWKLGINSVAGNSEGNKVTKTTLQEQEFYNTSRLRRDKFSKP